LSKYLHIFIKSKIILYTIYHLIDKIHTFYTTRVVELNYHLTTKRNHNKYILGIQV